jgi:tetratricopeptide (TPR) repeat protein
MFAMKKLLIAAIAACSFIIADAQLKTPAPSPTQTVKQDFGLSSIELTYSRPAVKGRKIFGDIVPFDAVWRTGANSATTLTFGDEVTIGGTKVPAGKYGLLTIPGKKSWTIIISKQTDVTSPAAYKQDMDLIRVTSDVNTTKAATESFTIQFANVKPTSCDLYIMWDKSVVVLPIATDIDAKIMANINEVMKGDKPPYFQAAMYYMDNGKDLNQALAWFNKAAEAQPDAFWVQHQWANCLAKLGQKNEAKTVAMKSRELAAAAKNDDYVKLNDKLLKDLGK